MKKYIINYQVESLDADKAGELTVVTDAKNVSEAITNLYTKIEDDIPYFIEDGRITYAVFIRMIYQVGSLEVV